MSNHSELWRKECIMDHTKDSACDAPTILARLNFNLASTSR